MAIRWRQGRTLANYAPILQRLACVAFNVLVYRTLNFHPSTPAGRVSFLGAITSTSSFASIRRTNAFPSSSPSLSPPPSPVLSPSTSSDSSLPSVNKPAGFGASILNFSLIPLDCNWFWIDFYPRGRHEWTPVHLLNACQIPFRAEQASSRFRR